MVRVLITGGSGLLGRYLQLTVPTGYEVRATYMTNPQPSGGVYMNLGSHRSVVHTINEVKPDVVIHAAGCGLVDTCQDDPAMAYSINVCGTFVLMHECINLGAKFVGISSNAVYHGDAAPYNEGDPTDPVNVYGDTKVLMEEAVRRFGMSNSALIIRPILLYGWPWPGGRKNWAVRALGMLEREDELSVVNDTLTQPTYAHDCAKVIWGLLDETGIWNVSSGDSMTLCDFVKNVACEWGYNQSLITPVASSHFPGIAPRPVDTRYALDKLHSQGYSLDNVIVGLERMRNEQQNYSGHIHT